MSETITKSKEETAFNLDQYELAYPEGIESHYWQKARAKIIVDEIKKANISNLNFLEIGCGRGTAVRLIKESGINIKGVELANIEPDKAVKEFIYSGKDALELDSELKQKVDCILLLDVIEHIEDPIKFIEEIMNAYSNAKYLLITVPARQELWSNYDEFYGHFKRYELNDFQLFKNLGYTNIITRYFYNSFYLAGKLVMKINKKRAIRTNAPKGFMKWIHRFIAWGLIVEYRIMPQKVYGLSVLSLMKKDTVTNKK